MKSFKGILVLGERNVFGELSKMISIASEANTILKDMFKSPENVQMLTDGMHKVRALEKKSDEIAFKLDEDITSGAISPNIIDDLIASVRSADNIVDTVFYLSRELARLAKANINGFHPTRTDEWSEIYLRMLDLVDQCLMKLQRLLKSSDMAEILRLRSEIEANEEEADDIKDVAFDKLYSSASNLHFLQFHSYGEMLHKTDDLLDNSETLADIVVSIVTSILK
jgi:uncharacterized protein Yka (UPF0111/DUF47 family)